MARWLKTLDGTRFDLDKVVRYYELHKVVYVDFCGNDSTAIIDTRIQALSEDEQITRCLQWIDWQIEQDNTNRVVAIPDFTLPAPVIDSE